MAGVSGGRKNKRSRERKIRASQQPQRGPRFRIKKDCAGSATAAVGDLCRAFASAAVQPT